uniref:Uncharacterized protein n=1 Tax=viral metagenome TaxID=1070528 RepID=A0A6C0LXB7_9ZZZZ
MTAEDPLFANVLSAATSAVRGEDLNVTTMIVLAGTLVKYVETLRREKETLQNGEKKRLVLDVMVFYVNNATLARDEKDALLNMITMFLPSIVDGLCSLKLNKVAKASKTWCASCC